MTRQLSFHRICRPCERQYTFTGKVARPMQTVDVGPRHCIVRGAFSDLRLDLIPSLCNDISVQLHFLPINDLKLPLHFF
jgi:hypothetical protein